MKNIYILIITIGFLACASVGMAKPIEISQILIFDDEGEDSTFQEIPELEFGKKIYQMISVTVTAPEYFDDISTRADRLFKRAKIKN